MSIVNAEDYSTSLRVVSTVIFVFATGCPTIAFVLLFTAGKSEKTAFVLLLKIFCLLSAVGNLAGWITMNATTWSDDMMLMFSFGPGCLLGPRFVHAVDFIAMLQNSWTAPFIFEMMFFRAMIVFNLKYSRNVMLTATAICIMYSFLICIPSLHYVDIAELRSNLSSEAVEQTYKRVSYGILMGPGGVGLWNFDSKIRASIVFFCFILAAAMVWKLHQMRGIMTQSTRNVHTGFLIILSFDAAVVFIYFLGANTGTFESLAGESVYLATMINTFSYPFFTFGPAVQSLVLLYLVPYLRTAMKRILLRKHNSVTVAIPSISIVHTQ